MKLITSEEAKIIMLDMLSAIDKFCCENNIVYSIACGTMLGAVRHGGFIPWDDDMDIYMLRKDYQKFISQFPSVLNDKYILITPDKGVSRTVQFSKISDVRTINVSERYRLSGTGVDIDVFPIDDVPDDNGEWDKYRKRQVLLYNLIGLKEMKISGNEHFGKVLKCVIAKLITFPFSNQLLGERLSQLAQVNNGHGYKRVFECVQGMRCKSPFPKYLFDNIIEWRFEDRIFHGFKDADLYLKLTYGDYMQLPPIEKRVCHHKELYWAD